MKFGKEFQSQMVPEWQEAYMDYNFLKTVLKDVMRFRPTKNLHSPGHGHATTPKGTSLKRKVTMYRAFSGLTTRHRHHSPRSEDEVILVSSVKPDGQQGTEGQYQTLFLRSSEEGGEYELVFFRRLDDEFNKVVKFYKDKVNEVVNEADELSRQMNALIALRIKVERPVIGGSGGELKPPSVAPAIPHSVSHRNPEMERMDVIQEVEAVGEEREGESKGDDAEKLAETTTPDRPAGTRIVSFRPAPLEILNHVKINVEAETPRSTVKGILKTSSAELSFSKTELRKAEERMTQAFITFHHKLRLLKSYCFLNQLAFSKIMKKYDKITSRTASRAYLKMVDDSYLGNSDEVNRLIERVEATVIKHFANGNREKGMRTLRPTAKRERHTVSFTSGCFFGFALALIVSVILTVHARDILKSDGRRLYMENIFPLYSLFGFVVLHLVMYAGNIFFWRRYRINYPFIFGFKQGTELGYREVLLVAFGLAVLMFAGVLSNLNMEMDPRTKSFEAITELVPLILLTVLLLIVFCPFNILYRSSRFFFLRCLYHCICAPFYKVTLPDFFLADQLTSQMQALRNLEFYICYYGWGDFTKRENTCSSSKVYETFYFIVAIIPYWMRFLQCLRRLYEEKDDMQGYNAIKYFSIIVALVLRSLYDLKGHTALRVLAGVFSGLATIVNTYWDLVIDWGLLRRNSKNKWLRDKLAVPNKTVYYVAIVLDVILRLAWMQVILGLRETSFLHKKALITIVASLEIIRRGIWNFFRIENEHLNNVGKYRAFKSVPLPFQSEEDKSM